MSELDGIAGLEQQHELHLALARRSRADAELAAAGGDHANADQALADAARYEALAVEDERKLHALKDRQRNALAQVTANHQPFSPDFTR